jgi:hypothetical protein
MSSTKTEEHSRSITIRAISFVFLINFTNIYSQIELLWSKQGILSVDHLLDIYKKVTQDKTKTNIFSKTFYPSIIPLLNNLFNISGETCLYIMSSLGAILSFLMLINKKFHKSIFMFIIWYFYLNIFLVGQHFMSFDFDHFNLEVGFISIFLCDFISFDTKFLQILSKYILKFTIFKILYSYALSLIFSNNKYIVTLQAYESFLLKQSIPSSTIVFLNKFAPPEFQTLLTALIFLVLTVVPFGMFCIYKRIAKISGIFIMIFCFNLTLIGNYGLQNIMLLAINFVNFDDEFLDLLFRLGEEKKVHSKDGRIITLPNEEELSVIIGIDIFIIIIFVIFSLFVFFPLFRINDGHFDLTPGGEKNPYRFLTISHLKTIMILFIIYIVIMSIIDYYNEHLKKEEDFKYVKNFSDLRNSCKMGIVLKILIFSVLGIIYLCHSADTFYSGLNIPMVTKKKGSFLYSSTHQLFNFLHDYTISSGYNINKGLLEERVHYGRDILVFKYLTETYVLEEEKEKKDEKKDEKINITNIINEINKTNHTNNINDTKNINKTNETLSDNINLNNNKTTSKKNKTKLKKKEEWKTVQFQHQINDKIQKNNLYFFISLLFKQPRLEYALHRLAYEGKNKLEDFNEKIWIPHLIYRLFDNKTNITKIKIEKMRYTFSKYSTDNNNFRSSFVSRYLDETNLTIIEDYLKKHHSLIVDKNIKKSIFYRIPFAAIIYALIFIFLTIKILPLFNEEEKNKTNKNNNIQEENDDDDDAKDIQK